MGEDSNLTRRVMGDGVELVATVAGSGPPVIFLHGFPENGSSWRHQIPAVTKAGFSAWAPDLRGYNRSGRPTEREAYHLRHLMADVAAIVRATGAPRAHIVGHDWGGIIAWSFAGHYAELVETLVIMNAPHLRIYSEKVWRSSQAFRSWYVGLFLLPLLPERLLAAGDFALLRRLFAIATGHTPAFTAADIDSYVAQFRAPHALTAALNYYRANAQPDAVRLGATSEISAPTLVLWGDKDKALGVELLEDLQTVAANVRLKRFATVGHWIQNEIPDDVNRLLLAFITNHGRGG
jgi:epoxide hydrolase 4